MNTPDLTSLRHWIGNDILEHIDRLRRKHGDIKRQRKLGTIEMIWLMIAVAVHSAEHSLTDIIETATKELKIPWSVSVSGFCKARARFSPPCPVHALRPPCRQTRIPLAPGATALPRLPTGGRR